MLIYDVLKFKLYFRTAGYVLRHISKIVGIKWELRRGEILQEERGAVIVANHQSMFDILGTSKEFINKIIFIHNK